MLEVIGRLFKYLGGLILVLIWGGYLFAEVSLVTRPYAVGCGLLMGTVYALPIISFILMIIVWWQMTISNPHSKWDRANHARYRFFFVVMLVIVLAWTFAPQVMWKPVWSAVGYIQNIDAVSQATGVNDWTNPFEWIAEITKEFIVDPISNPTDPAENPHNWGN